MTLEEFAQKIGYSETTIKTSFNRIKERLAKIGIIISKNNKEYFIISGEENIPWIHFRGKDLRNKKFGKLTVLELMEEKNIHNSHIWKCQCECGNICYVTSSCLTSGDTQSCGCKLSKNEIGNKYGKLIVIDYATKPDDKKNKGAYWLCQCECGNIVIRNGRKLRYGGIKSCGCIKSAGETEIEKILKENNIIFNTEYSFKDCIFLDTHYYARFDFYIPNKNYIIEYDGEQHFLPSFRASIEEGELILKKVQEHDKIKNQYCFEHNIPIIRIPYTHLKEICLEDLIPETSQFLLKQEE